MSWVTVGLGCSLLFGVDVWAAGLPKIGPSGIVRGRRVAAADDVESGAARYAVTARGGTTLVFTASSGPDGSEKLTIAAATDPERPLDWSTAKPGADEAMLAFAVPADGNYVLTVEGRPGPFTLKTQRQATPTIGGVPQADGRFALLIGIDDYPGDRVDLAGPSHDVDLMRDVLVKRLGYGPRDVLILRDKQATRANVVRAIRQHLGRAGAKGSAFLYYSGHGLKLDEGNVAVTGDADPETSDGQDEALFLADGSVLVDDELASLRESLHARQVVFVFDSCFSGESNLAGEVARNAKGIKGRFLDIPYRLPTVFETTATASRRGGSDEGAQGAAEVFVAASRGEEQSYTRADWVDRDDSRAASYFTFLLARALSDGGTKQPFAGVVEGAAHETALLVKSEHNVDQNPIIQGGRADASLETLLARQR
jgi:hypothetical protein